MASEDSKSTALVDELLSHLNANFVDVEPSSQVASFYANRSVFITGATGFIGKALVEKLIRSCKDIKRIYLLIREKRGKDVNERLAEFVQSPIFSRIRSHSIGVELLKEKLYAIRGDITMPKFGISKEDLDELSREVSIVYNSAATIRFVEPIDVAVRNNIYSVSQLVEFCDKLDNLKALIHLSTAYSNCHKRDTIYEIFYDPPMKGDQIINAVTTLKQIQDEIRVYPTKVTSSSTITTTPSQEDCSQLSENVNLVNCAGDNDDEFPSRTACEPQIFFKRTDMKMPNSQNIAPDLLEEFTQIAMRKSNRPNTYTLTKAISEYYLLELVQRRSERYLNDKIPVAVVRPSIVGGAWREPNVGYVDNYNGPTGAILSLYTGALQAMPGKGERVADLVPVDMVVNMLTTLGSYLVSEYEEQGCFGDECDRMSTASSLKNTKSGGVASGKIKRDNGAYVFNFVSGYRNPLHWHQVTELIAELSYKYPSKFLARLPSSYFINAGTFYNLYDKVNHKLPAVLQDFVRTTLLREELTSKTSAVIGYGRIRAMTQTLTPFTSNQWRLSDANVCALYDRLTPVDKQLFEFDVSKINWSTYIRNYIIGSRIYTLKDEAKNVPLALKKLRKRQTLSRVSCVVLLLLFYYFFCHQTQLEGALLGTFNRFYL